MKKQITATMVQGSSQDEVFISLQGVCPEDVARAAEPVAKRANAQLQKSASFVKLVVTKGHGALLARSLSSVLARPGVDLRIAA